MSLLIADVNKLKCINEGANKQLTNISNYDVQCNKVELQTVLDTSYLFLQALNISLSLCPELECEITNFMKKYEKYCLNSCVNCPSVSSAELDTTITMTCPSNIVVNISSGTGAVVNYTTPTGSTNCPNQTLTISRTFGAASGTTFTVAGSPHVITHQATNVCGNTITCSFNITVNLVG